MISVNILVCMEACTMVLAPLQAEDLDQPSQEGGTSVQHSQFKKGDICAKHAKGFLC